MEKFVRLLGSVALTVAGLAAFGAIVLIMGGVILLFSRPIGWLINGPVGENAFGVIALIIIAVAFLGLLIGLATFSFMVAAGLEAYSVRKGDQDWAGLRTFLAGVWRRMMGLEGEGELLAKKYRRKLPPLGSTKHDKDPVAQVKFYNGRGSCAWYATEFDGEDTLFGLVDGPERNLAYFSLIELQALKPPGLNVMCDTYWEPRLLSECDRLLEES